MYAYARWFLQCYRVHMVINALNAELNPICHLLALLGAHPILHISRIRVKVSKHHFSGPEKGACYAYAYLRYTYTHIHTVYV